MWQLPVVRMGGFGWSLLYALESEFCMYWLYLSWEYLLADVGEQLVCVSVCLKWFVGICFAWPELCSCMIWQRQPRFDAHRWLSVLHTLGIAVSWLFFWGCCSWLLVGIVLRVLSVLGWLFFQLLWTMWACCLMWHLGIWLFQTMGCWYRDCVPVLVHRRWYQTPFIPRTKVSPRGSFLLLVQNLFHIPVPSSMQEKVQLEGTTGKLGKSAWSLPWPSIKSLARYRSELWLVVTVVYLSD